MAKEAVIDNDRLVVVEMMGTAAGPDGTYLMGKIYEIPESKAREWATPHGNTGFIACKILRPKDLTGDVEIRSEPETDTEDKAKGKKKKE